MKNSFRNINLGLFLFIFIINSIYYFFLNQYLSVNIIILLNIIISILLIFINFYFSRDFYKIIGSIKNIKTNKDGFYSLDNNKTVIFKENLDLEKAIKNIILKSNIEKKDLSDLKNIYSKFISKEIYDELGIKGYDRIILGNFKIKKICIMFIDIAGFTALSENIKPERALFLLNIYFDGIGEIILKNNGYIDKYLGDGIMVIFEGNDIDNSIKTSMEIQEFIEKFKIGELGKKIQIGIGINYGEVILGTIGNRKRMEATVIGDTINIASRLQYLTRKYDTSIIVSEFIYEKIKNKENYQIKNLGKEALKGKQKEIQIYGIEPYYLI